MKGLITYENQRRIDEYMFSRTAFRELLYYSLQHKLYNTGNPIQISIYRFMCLYNKKSGSILLLLHFFNILIYNIYII